VSKPPIPDPPTPDPQSPIPLWIRLLDGAVVALFVLAVFVAVYGGFRFWIGGVRVSATSALRLVLWATIAFALRHAVVRHPSLAGRLRDGWRQARHSKAVAVVTPAFVVSRLAVLVVGYFAVVTIGYPDRPPFRVSHHELWNLPARWDAGWYLGIAADGYHWDGRADGQQNIAFFPAFPLLMRVAGTFFGARPPGLAAPGQIIETYHPTLLYAGIFVSLVAFYWALLYLYRLARQDLSDEEAGASVVLLAAYPFALFYSAPYTEALFLLGAVGAFYHFRRNDWVAASAWGLLVGLTRPNGCLLSIPLAVLAAGKTLALIRTPEVGSAQSNGRPTSSSVWRRAAGRGAPWLTAAMPGVGMLLFSAFLHQFTGNAFMWAAAHRAWGRTYKGLDALVMERYEFIAGRGLYEYTASMPIDLLNVLPVILALVLIWPVWRRFGLAYVAFVLVNLVPPLLAGGFLSMGRLTAVLFPMFFALAAIVPPRHRPAWVCGFAILQGFAATLFFTWRPLY
jgi:hypothetical protein